MKALLDTCVIYPTVMREMLLEVAKGGGFEPLWSARILEEWQRAATKLGPDGMAQAAGELAGAEAGITGMGAVNPRGRFTEVEGVVSKLPHFW